MAWGSTSSSAGVLHRGPDALGLLQDDLPLFEGLLGEEIVEKADAGRGVLPAGGGVDEAGVVLELGRAEEADEVAPVAIGLQHHEGEEAPVRGLVHADDGVRGFGAVARRHPGHPEEPGGHGRGGGGPHGRAEQGVVDDGRLAGVLAVVEGGRNPPGNREAADDVAERRPRLG